MHLVPPVLLNVSVVEPATHAWHFCLESAVYLPAPHLVHLMPPLLPNVSVTEPALHVAHAH